MVLVEIDHSRQSLVPGYVGQLELVACVPWFTRITDYGLLVELFDLEVVTEHVQLLQVHMLPRVVELQLKHVVGDNFQLVLLVEVVWVYDVEFC